MPWTPAPGLTSERQLRHRSRQSTRHGSSQRRPPHPGHCELEFHVGVFELDRRCGVPGPRHQGHRGRGAMAPRSPGVECRDRAGSFSPTPGGIGVVDAAMIAASVVAGLRPPEAVAAVLIYRLVNAKLVVTMVYFVQRSISVPRTLGGVRCECALTPCAPWPSTTNRSSIRIRSHCLRLVTERVKKLGTGCDLKFGKRPCAGGT